MAKEVGWKGVFNIYPIHNFLKGAKLPVVIWIPTFILFLMSETDTLDLLSVIVNIITGGFPSIIGFILTGHALIIGFSGSDFILSLAKTREDQRYSYLQKVNSTLSVVTGILIVTLIIAAIVALITKMEIVWPFPEYCDHYNAAIFGVVLFAFYYSVFSLLDIVINIFNLGQISNKVAQGKIRAIESGKDQGNGGDPKTTQSIWIKVLNIFNINDIFSS